MQGALAVEVDLEEGTGGGKGNGSCCSQEGKERKGRLAGDEPSSSWRGLVELLAGRPRQTQPHCRIADARGARVTLRSSSTELKSIFLDGVKRACSSGRDDASPQPKRLVLDSYGGRDFHGRDVRGISGATAAGGPACRLRLQLQVGVLARGRRCCFSLSLAWGHADSERPTFAKKVTARRQRIEDLATP